MLHPNEKMKACQSILPLMVLFALSISSGGCSTEEDSPGANLSGAQLDVVLSNDWDNPPDAAAFKKVVFTDGTYTPDLYILGLRYLGLIRCLDTNGTDMICPGTRGEEIDYALAADESMDVFLLNEDITTDYIIYENEEGDVNASLGDSGEIDTTPIDEPGLYSGLRLGLDFVMTAFPSYDSSVDFGVNGYEFVFLCLNENGCSNLTGFEASYLEVLTTVPDGDKTPTGIQLGDIIFLDLLYETGDWWDLDLNSGNGWFSPLSSGRPANPLNQAMGSLVHGDDGEWVYNASFGASTSDDLAPFDITQELIDAGATATLTAIFSVEGSMSFEDENANNILDYWDLVNFRYGKPRISELTLGDDTFFER